MASKSYRKSHRGARRTSRDLLLQTPRWLLRKVLSHRGNNFFLCSLQFWRFALLEQTTLRRVSCCNSTTSNKTLIEIFEKHEYSISYRYAHLQFEKGFNGRY
jgi:hypothetical protein